MSSPVAATTRVWRLDGVPLNVPMNMWSPNASRPCAACCATCRRAVAVTHRLHRIVSDELLPSCRSWFRAGSCRSPVSPGCASAAPWPASCTLHWSTAQCLAHQLRPCSPASARARQDCPRPGKRHCARWPKSALVERALREFGPTLLAPACARPQPVRGRRSSSTAWSTAAGSRCRTAGPAVLHAADDQTVLRRRQAGTRQATARRYAALVDIGEYADAVEPASWNAALREFNEDSEFDPARGARRCARWAARDQ